MAKQQRRSHARLSADDVLDGRTRPNARELLTLIHEVNPSGHDLPTKEAARRYAQKSRLQSLLVRRYPEEIVVEPDDDPAIVGLRHRSSGADACHAVLASLDDDARSWVQMRLDLGDDEESPRSLDLDRDQARVPSLPPDAPLDDLSTDQLLRSGRAALEAYDYDAARARFAAAFDRGDREALAPLLLVLVERLGLDEDALALEPRADADALRRPELRLFFAQAAARRHERDRAIRHVGAQQGDDAADVFVSLARGALEAGELANAAADIAEAQHRSPSHPALVDLAETVKKRRAQERAPIEIEAQRLFDAGLFDEAEAKGASLAARWPESAVAKTIARAGQERRRVAEARQLASQGKAAIEGGEGARALTLLRRAKGLGLRDEEAAEVDRALVEAAALEQTRLEREQVVEVVRWLREGHTLRGLTEYAELPDRLHGPVHAILPMDEMVYIDQMALRPGGLDAKGAATAAMALVRAFAIATDAGGAIDLMTPHMRALQTVPDAVTLYQQSEHIVALKRQVDAQARLNMALSAFGGGTRQNIVRSIELMQTVKAEDLDEGGRVVHETYFALARQALELWDRGHRIQALRAAERLFDARDAANELIEVARRGPSLEGLDPASGVPRPPPEAAWVQVRDDIVRDLKLQCDLQVSGPPADAAVLALPPRPLRDVPQSVLRGPDGEPTELVLAEGHGDIIFLLAVDLTTGAVTRRASMRKQQQAFTVARVQACGGNVVLLGNDGTVVEVDPRDWQPIVARTISLSRGPAEDLVLAPGGRFVWGRSTYDGWWGAVTVLDQRRDEYVRTWSERFACASLAPLVGLAEPRVVEVRDDVSVVVYEARSTALGSGRRSISAVSRGVVVHPRGDALFALLCDEPDIDRVDDPIRVYWAELSLDGGVIGVAPPPVAATKGESLPTPGGAERTVDGFDALGTAHQLATALDDRVTYVLFTEQSGARRLVAYGLDGDDRIAQRFATVVPSRVTLVQDAGARRVFAVSPSQGGLEIVRLGAAPPRFRHEAPLAPALDADDLSILPRRPCVPVNTRLWTFQAADTHHQLRAVGYLAKVEKADRAGMIEHTFEPAERWKVVARFTAALTPPTMDFADAFASAALARFAGDAEMRQIPAVQAAMAGAWSAVRRELEGIDAAQLDDAAAQHHDHLLGAALLAIGEVDEARRVLRRGAARVDGRCDLAVLLALTAREGDEPASASPKYAVIRELDRALRAADARLAAADARGARAALSGFAVRESREVQTLARLCRAWIDDDDPEVDAFERRMAVAAFRSGHAEKALGARRELPFAGARWDEAKLDALAEEAGAWLMDEVKARRARYYAARPPKS